MSYLVKTPSELADKVAIALSFPPPLVTNPKDRLRNLIWTTINEAGIKDLKKRKDMFRAIQKDLSQRSAAKRKREAAQRKADATQRRRVA